MTRARLPTVLVGLLLMTFSSLPSLAKPGDFVWPTLTIDVGTTAGGGFDIYARLLSRYIGKYLPGRPDVIIQNRPGAGGMLAFNYLYNLAPKDGTEIASSAPGLMIDRLIYQDKSNARFDAEKFNAIGSMNADFSVFIARTKSDLNLKTLLGGKAFPVGTAGPGGNPELYGRALNEILKTKLNLISGYPGMAEVLHALEQSELDGIPGVPWNDIRSEKKSWLTSNFVQPIIQYREKRAPDLPNVPAILELVSDPVSKEAITVLMEREKIARPFFAPPGVPPDRLKILRQAFDRAMRNPDLIAEAKKMSLDLDVMSGADADALVKTINHPSAQATAKLRQIF
jgi:tripartite-type tricarboxylate transporter receptor subunit TctC